MFEDSGYKLEIAAKILFVLGIISSIVLAIVFGKDRWGDFNFWWFLLIVGSGSVSSYLSCLVMVAIGQAQQDAEINHQYLATLVSSYERQSANSAVSKSDMPTSYTKQNTSTSNSASSKTWTCPKCGKLNGMVIGTCSCGESRPRS